MLLSLGLFALGSALCGSAQNIPWLIAARSQYSNIRSEILPLTYCIVLAIQGMGGGGILSITNIIISDLVPLKERGAISGVLGL